MSSSNAYMAEYLLKRYYRRQAAAIEQLGGKCRDCGATEALEFHHVYPDVKTFTICEKLATISEAKLQAELALCTLLCVSCHCAWHWARRHEREAAWQSWCERVALADDTRRQQLKRRGRKPRIAPDNCVTAASHLESTS